MADAKSFRRQVWDNPRLVVSTCMLCEQVAASADLRLLSLVEALHECRKENNSSYPEVAE